jgi:hypothetical protein
MNSETADNPVDFSRFRMSKKKLALGLLAIVAIAALIEFFVLGLARRTFVFYAIDSGIATVEERMLKTRSSSREVQITRYVEEALLGPVSPNSLPLFPRETRLVSLLYRNGVVYVNLSEDAALPPLEGVPVPDRAVFINMETLYHGIKRNFSFVREVRFFIAGNAAFAGQFR